MGGECVGGECVGGEWVGREWVGGEMDEWMSGEVPAGDMGEVLGIIISLLAKGEDPVGVSWEMSSFEVRMSLR